MPLRHINDTRTANITYAKKAADIITNGETLFTITGGPIWATHILGVCVSANNNTATTVKFVLTPTTGVATDVSIASQSIASVPIGSMIEHSFATLGTAPAVVGANTNSAAARPTSAVCLMAPGVISTTITVGPTTGTWEWYLIFTPSSPDVIVS